MTLAFLIAICVGASLASAVFAARSRNAPTLPLVLSAVLLPLAAFAYMQTQARPTRSALAFEVIGQFHSLGDAITFSDDANADVFLGDRVAASVSLEYNAPSRQYDVQVRRSAEPVMFDGVPINGGELRRSNSLTAEGKPDKLDIVRPWWCWLICAQYKVTRAGEIPTTFELNETPTAIPFAGRTVRLLRSRGKAFVIADPNSGVLVNSQRIPNRLTLRGDTLRIGPVSFAIIPQSAQHRTDVVFTRSAGRERWDLPADLAPNVRFLVAATNTDTVPGTMHLLNPAEVAPGAAKRPYGGFIERLNDEWSWRPAGSAQAKPIALNQTILLPGQSDGRSTGHLVQLQQRDTKPGSAILAVAAVWIAGALLLAFVWRSFSGVPLAFRLATAGCLYTLIFIRSIVAFRAWLAPPHSARVIVVLLSLLIALPAVIAAYHFWEESRDSSGSLRQRVTTGWPVLAFVAACLAMTAPLVLRGWIASIALNVVATLVVGVAGLAILQSLLIAPHLKAQLHGPLSSLDEQAARDYTYRQFITAVTVLAFVGALFALVAGAIRYGQLIAASATACLALGLVWLDASFAPFVRPTRTSMRIGFGVAGALTLGLGVYLTFLSVIAALLAAAAGGVIGYVAVERPRPRIRPFSLRQAIRPGLLASVSLGLILLISTGLLSRVRVLVGYALAIAGMIVIVRIFTILWFRQSDQARRISTRQHAVTTYRIPSILALATVLVLTLAVYVPLGLTDPGLVLLFFSAAIVAAMIGLTTVGKRGVILGFGMLAVIFGGFFLVMNVRKGTLEQEQPISLTTAQTRFAAAIHPEALQRNLVAADVGSAREILNTLQQDWGMQYYAALGGTAGRGYFGADFLDRGVTSPVALAENSYGVFVLSEHGWLGGVAVLAAYLALVLVLLTAAAFCCDQATQVPRGLLLSGLAAFWVIPTLYMIAANASLLPLTGQNVPWLGMLSPADAAFGVILGALALHALPRAIAGKPGKAMPIEARLRGVRKGIGITALVSIALAITVSVALWKPLHQPATDFRLDAFLARVDELVQNRAILPGDSISVAGSAKTLPAFNAESFLTRTIRTSNSLDRGERATSGYCYARDPLLRVTSEGNIAVTRSFCGLGIGTGSRYAWRGSLRSGPPGEDLVLTNGRTTVLFAQNARNQAVVGSGPQCDVGLVRASTARIGCQKPEARVSFGSSTLTFEPLNGGSVLLNAKAANRMTMLQAGDYIASPDGANFIVTAVPRGSAMYARWQNGGYRRIASPTTGAWLQQLDAQLARALGTRDQDNPDAVLTLDPVLHDGLVAALKSACPKIAGATSCSALMADPVTGAIVAFADWRAEPGSGQRYRALDGNLRNHPPASAIKPIVAAAALHAYPKLQTLEIDHEGTQYTVVANTNLYDTLRAARYYPNRRINFNAFIGASDNLYAASLGFLAAGQRGRNDLPETRGTGNPSGVTVAGQPLNGSPLRRGDPQLERTPFAEALEQLYGVTPAGAPPQPHDAAFWERALDAGVLRRGDDLQRISPEAVTLDLDRVDYPRTLASFMIGGASNRWNNVAMVQAISRLFTGTRVELYLLDSVGDREIAPKPELDAALLRLKPVIREAMRTTIHENWGTAYALHAAFDTNRVNWVGKTGTLAEREWTGSAFMWVGEAGKSSDPVCPTAGIILVELRRGTNPDGKATVLFRDQVAGLLRERRGWGTMGCVVA